MFVGEADTLVLNVAAANLYMLAVNRPFSRLVKVIMETFSVFMVPHHHLFLVFDLLLTCMTESQCSGIDLSSLL